jgi:hypothetical protein
LLSHASSPSDHDDPRITIPTRHAYVVYLFGGLGVIKNESTGRVEVSITPVRRTRHFLRASTEDVQGHTQRVKSAESPLDIQERVVRGKAWMRVSVSVRTYPQDMRVRVRRSVRPSNRPSSPARPSTTHLKMDHPEKPVWPSLCSTAVDPREDRRSVLRLYSHALRMCCPPIFDDDCELQKSRLYICSRTKRTSTRTPRFKSHHNNKNFRYIN